jgi:hypothetical protein
MQRSELEHILRAAAGITGASEFVVIGSQSVHGQVANPPAECLVSMEADLFTFRSTEDANLIDGSIGEASPFHRTFGYYAHGVGEETASLAKGWRERLVPLRSPNTGQATGLCLEIHDLVVSKLVAGREKDISFVRALLQRGLIKADVINDRFAVTPLDPTVRAVSMKRLENLLESSRNA